MAIDYKSAGVDVEAGYEAVRLMKEHVRSTFSERVIGDVGSFGGCYSIAGMGITEPVLVSGTDGVGTKLKIAFALDRHDTVGIDCVAMCVNDVLCQGAQPLFFLDYIATGRLIPGKVAAIVSGVAEGCRRAGCALMGGETAEMPGFYSEGEYDIAGFTVGIAERSRMIDGSAITPGDTLVGLESSGVHSNGFSLIRRVLGEDAASLGRYMPELGRTIGEELLTPTRIYAKPVLEIMSEHRVKGAAHITGGGFLENIPRMLPPGARARVREGAWPVPPVFGLLIRESGMSLRDAYNTFNMGIGMVLAVPAGEAAAVVDLARALGAPAHVIGDVVPGEPGVEVPA